jgi:hypothetical protein
MEAMENISGRAISSAPYKVLDHIRAVVNLEQGNAQAPDVSKI